MDARWGLIPAACLLTFLLTAAPAVTDCPAGYEELMDRCYRFHNAGGNMMSWNDAQSDCLADGALLVGLETPGEYLDVVEWVRLKAPSGVELWTALQEDSDFGWHWSNTADRWVQWWPGEGTGAGETVATLITRDPATTDMVGLGDSSVDGQKCCHICEYDSSPRTSFINVARTFTSVDCSTAVSDGPCSSAVDGRLIILSDWVSENTDGVGAWVQITFDAIYVLTFMRAMQRNGGHELNKDILVTFDEGPELRMTLEQVYTAWDDYNGQVWNEMIVDDVSTSTARIEVTAIYTQGLNGFSEIEFYVGTNPCPPRYTLVDHICYRYFLADLIPWDAARQACADQHAELVAMETAGERDQFTAWIKRSFHIDGALLWTSGKLSADGETWQWGDSDDTWFDWEPSQPAIQQVGAAVVALNMDTLQLVTAAPTDNNQYICEYKCPVFASNAVNASLDMTPIQDGRRGTCMPFTQLHGHQLSLVWHTDVFIKIRVLLWRNNFSMSAACNNNATIVMMTSTSSSHLAEPPCQPFCGILVICSTQQIREDVEILECTCPTNACMDIVLHFQFPDEAQRDDYLEICHLDVFYLE